MVVKNSNYIVILSVKINSDCCVNVNGALWFDQSDNKGALHKCPSCSCFNTKGRSSMNEGNKQTAVTLNSMWTNQGVLLCQCFPGFTLADCFCTAQHSSVGGLQLQQLSKGGPQTYQITLTPPPRGASKRIMRGFLGHHRAQQAAGGAATAAARCYSNAPCPSCVAKG